MAALDFLKNLGSGISPNTEELLAAIPTLLGAYEQGRGRPFGNVLSAAGGLLGQNVANRRQKGDVGAMLKMVQGSVHPGSLADRELQQFLGAQQGMSMEGQQGMLQNILGEAQAEMGKKPAQYYNTQTGQIEQHDPMDFPGGTLPSGLIPWGTTAATAYAQRHGLPTKEAQANTEWDVLSNAKYGKPFTQLQKENPKAAADILTQWKLLGAQQRSDVQFNQYERERGDRLADAVSKILTSSEASKSRYEDELKDRYGLVAHGPIEQYIQDYYHVDPGQLRNMPTDKAEALRQKAAIELNIEAAGKTAATTTARIKATSAGAVGTYLNTPVDKSGWFVVNPKDDTLVHDPSMTLGQASRAGMPTIYKTELNGYTQGLEARDSLKGLPDIAKTVLPPTPNPLWNKYTVEARMKALSAMGNVNAGRYIAAQARLISYLRTLARTSRPNQAEINRIIPAIEGASNFTQLQGIIKDAQNVVNSALKSMQFKGRTAFSGAIGDIRSKTADAVTGASAPKGDTSADTPGISTSF